jgi:hypothetical protein
VTSKGGTRNEPVRGGQEHHRFKQRRLGQARVAHEGAADVAARVLLPRLRDLDAVVLGGDRFALAAVLDDPRLVTLARLTTERVLDVPDARLAVMRSAPERFRATIVRPSP